MASVFQSSTALIISLFVFSVAASPPTAYELLQSYGFPQGILPRGITHYDLDLKSGKFNAYLNGTCSFSLEGSYQLKYNSKISGIICKDRLTNLSGVSVKVWFVWLNIVEVTRTPSNLEFSVGIASAEFPLDNFYVCPQCGCGLNCKTEDSKRKMGVFQSHPLVSEI